MGVLKVAKPPLRQIELSNRRQRYFKKSLLESGIGDEVEKVTDWRKLMMTIVENEGRYTITSKGLFIKNEAMRLIETMAGDPDPRERIMACIWLGEMRLNFPEFADRKNFPVLSGWMDDLLIILGTDGDSEVRKYTFTALNKTVSLTEISLKKLGELEEKENKRKKKN